MLNKFCFWLLVWPVIGLLLLSPSLSKGSKEKPLRSIYPKGEIVFDPSNPKEHASWKGHETLPLAEMQQLCTDLAAYLEVDKENGAKFLLEIAAAESDFGYYVRQVRGPAQSVWQIEPETARDLYERLPKRNPQMYQKIMALRDPNLDEEENVVTNLNYAGALCLGVLYLKGIKFEQLNSLEIRAMAWKKHYNTYLGKGTLEGYCQKSLKYVGGQLDPNFRFNESFDPSLIKISENIFATRDQERFLTLPPDFDESEMGRYYQRILREKPEVFEEIPRVILKSPKVKVLMQALTWELIRKVQKDPSIIASFRDMPKEILDPLVQTAMLENALKAYPNLPPSYQNRPDLKKIYDNQVFLQKRLNLKGK